MDDILDVDSGPLTHGLDEHTTQSPVSTSFGSEQLLVACRQVLPLPFDLIQHLGEFGLDDLGIGIGDTTM